MGAWRNAEDLAVRVIAPGLRQDFAAETPTQLAEQPTAVVTTHPSHGLGWLVDLWAQKIQPAVPNARLVIVSNLLDKGKSGADMPEDIRMLGAKIAATEGIAVVPPGADSTMAALYRSARVHLYPGHPDDMVCWTLMESQACGLPAVARPLGAIHERLRDGETGQIVPDDEAFANVAIRLLTDDEMFWSMNREARLLQRDRSWETVAGEFSQAFTQADRR